MPPKWYLGGLTTHMKDVCLQVNQKNDDPRTAEERNDDPRN